MENAKRVIKQCEKICANNTTLLLNYVDFKRAQRIFLGRVAKFLYTLKNVAVMLKKDFKDATKEEGIRVFAEIKDSGNYKASTKRGCKTIIIIKIIIMITRSSTAWLFDMTPKYVGYPDVLKWLRISDPKNQSRAHVGVFGFIIRLIASFGQFSQSFEMLKPRSLASLRTF